MRWIWNVMGWSAVGIGAIGIVVPLLPTTPFLLLAAACFSKGSARFREALLQAPVLGAPLRDYLEHRRVPRNARRAALLLIWTGLSASILLAEPPLAVLFAAFIAASAVSLYLLSLPVTTASVRE